MYRTKAPQALSLVPSLIRHHSSKPNHSLQSTTAAVAGLQGKCCMPSSQPIVPSMICNCSSKRVSRACMSSMSPSCLKQAVSFLPSSPAAQIPEGYSDSIELLYKEIRQAESDLKFLSNAAWLLYGLVFTIIISMPGRLADLGGETSGLDEGFDTMLEYVDEVDKRLDLLQQKKTSASPSTEPMSSAGEPVVKPS